MRENCNEDSKWIYSPMLTSSLALILTVSLSMNYVACILFAYI